jgi:gliding motility-associated-like protein
VIDRDGSAANIGIFDAVNNSLVRRVVFRNAVNTLSNAVNYDCVKTPTGVCVRQYIFKEIITIDPGSNGLIVSHQLCCRNGNNDNVQDAGAAGSTYWCYIPPNTIVNSSPRFNEIPPTYVCIDAPLDIDYSALDPDGDSLVYEFYTPYIGGSTNDPKPNTPSAPPYNAIIWDNTFFETNQVTGSPANYINSSTGQYTLTPTSIGTYTIGIKVSEYRNGVFLSSTLSDYQFNVINCQFDIVSNFDVPGGTAVGGAYTFECGDTICFRNISETKDSASTSYFWDFGDPASTTDTFTTFTPEKEVCYVYPGNGDYTVTLKSINSICVSTFRYQVRIRSTKNFTLGPDKIFCDDFSILLDTRVNDAISTSWNTGESTQRITATDTGMYIANVSFGKCKYSDTLKITYDNVLPKVLADDSLFCGDFLATLDAGISGVSYLWSTSPAEISKTITVQDTGIYTVTMANSNCSRTDSIRLWQSTKPDIRDSFYCNDFIHLADAGALEEATYLWSDGTTNQFTNYTSPGIKWVRITQRDCIHPDSFEIGNSLVNSALGEDMHFCDILDFTLDAGTTGTKFDWSTGESTRTIRVLSPGKYTVRIENAEGCTTTDSITLTFSISPEIYVGEDTTICVNSPTQLGIDIPYAIYSWNTGEATQYITAQTEGIYRLQVTDDLGCIGTDSLFISVDPEALPSILFVPNAFTPNEDNLNEIFPYKEEVIQPAFYITIYSRWGEKVFDSREANTTNWNGYYKGQKVPPTTYMYFMYYRGCDGNARTAKGTVQVIY